MQRHALPGGERDDAAGDVVGLAERHLQRPHQPVRKVGRGGIALTGSKLEPRITREALAVLSVESSVKSRTSYGGTAPKNVLAQAKAWLKRLEKERKLG